MSFLIKLFEKLNSYIKNEDRNKILQLLLIRIFNFVGIALLGFSLIVDLINTQELSSLVLVLPLVLLLFSLTSYSNKIEKINASINILIISYVIASVYNIFRLPMNLAGIFWIFSFPVLY